MTAVWSEGRSLMNQGRCYNGRAAQPGRGEPLALSTPQRSPTTAAARGQGPRPIPGLCRPVPVPSRPVPVPSHPVPSTGSRLEWPGQWPRRW